MDTQSVTTTLDRPLATSVASIVSWVVNPLVLPPVLFGLVLAHFGAAGTEGFWLVAFATAFFCLFPLVNLIWTKRARSAVSIELPERTDRHAPILGSVVSYLLMLFPLSFALSPARTLLISIVAVYAANTVIIALINTRLKISLHVSSIAGFASIILFLATTQLPTLVPASTPALLQPSTALLLVLLVPVLMWSRIVLKAHTRQEVLAGAALGFAMPLIELHLFRLVGVI